MKKHIFFSCTLLFAALHTIAQNIEINLKKFDTIQYYQLSPVVISVNKIGENKNTLPQQVEVLDAKTIENTQAATTADLLSAHNIVGIQKSQQGGGSVTIRGFEANRNLLIIDGVRMNNIIYRGGHLQNIITTDPCLLERVEVLSGPASTVHGTDALGGVVSMTTRGPQFSNSNNKQFNTHALVRLASANTEKMIHVDAAIATNKWASLTSFTFNQYNDLKNGSNQNPLYDGNYIERNYYVVRIGDRDSLMPNKNKLLQVQSNYNQYHLMQKFAFKPKATIEHGLNIQYSTTSDVPRYDRLTDPNAAGLKYAEWNYGPQKRMLIAYDYSKNNGLDHAWQTLIAKVNYQMIEESRITRKFNSNNRAYRIENVGVLGASIQANRYQGKHTLYIGADMQYNNLKSTAKSEQIITSAITPLDTRYPNGINTMLNAGIYASHKYKINETLMLNEGLRIGLAQLHSTFEDTTFFKLPYTKVKQNNVVYAANIGLVATPSDDIKISALIATGFRAPNVDDLSKVFESALGLIIVPNANLKPEKTISNELSITKFFNNNKQSYFENTMYYTHFYDAIVTDAFKYNNQDSIMYENTLSQVLANQNKRKAYIYGFSSQLQVPIITALNLKIGMNYTYGRIKTDSLDAPLDHIQPFNARLGLNYKLERFMSEFYINYCAAKKLKNYYLNGEDNEQYATPIGMPAWFTVNIHTSYQLSNLLKIQVGIDNILDIKYRTFASGINAPGRNIYAALRFDL